MDNNSLNKENILENFGGAYANSLNEVINNMQDEYEINTMNYSQYYSLENMPSILKDKTSNLVILSLNAQSIFAKFNSIDIMMKMLNEQGVIPDIILIQETWLENDENINLLQLEGYNCFNQGYKCSRHGGLMTYIKNDFDVKVLNICPTSNIWEGLFVEIKTKDRYKTKFIIGNIYKPPRDNNSIENIETFISEFEPVLNHLNKTKAEVMIGGDWNINLLDINKKSAFSNFLDMMLNMSFSPKINFPTRFSSRSASLIDNIYCKLSNKTMDTFSGILFTGVSDHLPYFVCLNNILKQTDPNPKFVKCRINKPEAIKNLTEDLIRSNIYDSLDKELEQDPNKNYDVLIEKVTKLKEKHFPFKLVKFNKHKHKNKSWITNGIIKSISFRDNLLQIFKKTRYGTPEFDTHKNNLSAYNKILKKSIREAKIHYYHKKFDEYKHDIKNTWKTISQILGNSSKKSNPIKEIRINNHLYNNMQDICNKFNDFFFVNIGPNLAAEIKSSTDINYKSYLKRTITSSFTFDLVNEDEVRKTINSLKTKDSAGHDGISTKLLKVIGPTILKPLTLILNQSLITGIFPENLKVAKVSPLFKKDDKLIMDNYRPVSLLTSISKLFGKVFHKQFSIYFKENKLFYKSQYGFREEHSTELASIELIDRIMSCFEKKYSPFAIYMDLSKAFDTLDHKILLYKLK